MTILEDAVLTVAGLQRAMAEGTIGPVDIARAVSRRATDGDPAIWIALRPEKELLAEAKRLAALDPETHPLRGIPFAVKDNVDVAGMPTTAACPAFSYVADQDAEAVRRLRAAGALMVGKTNLDQFATGLVGVRSPYGVPGNSFDPAFVPGGSSSGSAVAVAAGLVSFSIGTDTAGSGRVPAAFNNLVGWKPSKGLLSTTGLVPACRSLDCLSVFALTAADAAAVAHVATAFDPQDPFSRALPADAPMTADWAGMKVGVPIADNLEFFGDADAAALFDRAVAAAVDLGAEPVAIDITPFLDAARLLYEGPWVSERYVAIEALMLCQPEALHPVTREIISGGRDPLATDLFKAEYKLAALRRLADQVLETIDLMILPTAGTIYRIEEVEADPVRLNSNLGRYTNFMNLLDMSGVAVPGGFRSDGMPLGVTLAAPAFHDHALLSLAGPLHRACVSTIGAGGTPLPPPEMADVPSPSPGDARADMIEIAVCGAHMSGLPLNGELLRLGGEFVESVRTAPRYRFYALAGPEPKRPGLVRGPVGQGAAIEVEVWAIPRAGIGDLLAAIPSPLGLGNLLLDDGRTVKGFVCEAAGVEGAREITAFGSWRHFLADATAVEGVN